MTADEKAFQKALKRNRHDIETRKVYADWLEERGRDDEAAEQRRMATAAWCEADRWLHEFAEKCGHADYGDPKQKITYDHLIQSGHRYRDCDGYQYFPEFDSETGVRAMEEGDNLSLFWRHWSTVTGVNVGQDEQGQVFECSC